MVCQGLDRVKILYVQKGFSIILVNLLLEYIIMLFMSIEVFRNCINWVDLLVLICKKIWLVVCRGFQKLYLIFIEYELLSCFYIVLVCGDNIFDKIIDVDVIYVLEFIV